MARIPIYQRQTSAAVGTQLDLPRASAEAFGGGFGASLERAGGQMRQREMRAEREAQEAADNSAMTEAALAVERAQADINKRALAARESAGADGSGHAEAVLTYLDERSGEVLGAISNPRARQWAELRLTSLRGDVDVREAGWAAGLRAAKTAGDYSMARDVAANGLFTAPDRRQLDTTVAQHEQLVDGLALPADVKAKLKAENRAQFAESYAQGLAERDPYALRGEIDGGSLNALLNPDAIATLRNRADGEIRGREAQVRAEQAQRRAEARAAEAAAREAARAQRAADKDWADGIVAASREGVPIPMDVMRRAASVYARQGNPGAALTAATIGTRNAVNTQYGRMSPVELQRAEQQLSTEIAKAGASADPTMIAARDQLRTLRARQHDVTRTDLLGWAAQQGTSIPDLDPANPDSFRQRGDIARNAARTYRAPVQPLRSTEVDAFAETFATGSAQQKMQAARTLSLFGRDATAAAAQVAKKDQLAGWAIGLSSQGRFAAAQDLFNGADYLRSTPKLAPKDKVDERWAGLVGDMFRFWPAAGQAAKAAATNIYAARWGRDGGTDWRHQAFDAGTDMAFGGIVGADGVKRGGLGEWAGAPLPLPSGVSQEQFDRTLMNLTDGQLRSVAGLRPVGERGQDISAEAVKRGRLYPAGDGHYYVVLPGATNPLRRPDGQLFALRVGQKAAEP
jgi:hypothetical protein